MRFAVATASLFAGAALASVPAYEHEYAYETHTITSCPPEVTSCPASTEHPVHETTSTPVVEHPPYPTVTEEHEHEHETTSAWEEEYTTSTVYATSMVTVTSCAPTVTYCPSSSTVVVTSVIPISTTVCPVTHTPTHSYSTSHAVPTTPSTSKTTTETHKTEETETHKTETKEHTETETKYHTNSLTKTHVSSSSSVVHPVPTSETAYPTKSLSTIVSSYSHSPSPSKTAQPTGPHYPIPTGGATPSHNVSSPVVPSKPAAFKGAASTVGSSLIIAGLAAIGAVFLA